MATTVSRKSGTRKGGVRKVRSGGNGLISALGTVLRGVLVALAVTLAGVVVLALFIKWTTPSDVMISVLNQALKLLAIALACWLCLRRNPEGGLLQGAGIGFTYMLLGVLAYSLLSGLPVDLSAYLADLGMGVAAGGLCGVIFPGIGK